MMEKKTQRSKPKWRIVFYPHLHPIEPRAYGEMQPNNKRIYIFTKHKRHSKIGATEALYHEVTHLIFYKVFGSERRRLFDYVLDVISYHISKGINRKKSMREKGWNYFKQCRMKQNAVP